ncbi:MAG: hypothetical protein A3H69_03825 [Candidatus Sungbacteria bacterium RIFCSPLOWO2_02_FULL_47_9]|uniref:Segregation and condensation protein A n=1 Tax=Candidatus Sungbacteria bacterium RIFCSPHIGHO2_01_FULL_47_32 TaxID=1802264 RepID=A0A1G2K2I0_9BACT|nr:MAG: hypothetical protein A2633_04655 [Candidatus Sungbacteria bacterium RIFCSPHIGHO2_01_FULL_47_32]OHA05457.1 MAG: hypothetical protein A3A28_03115 [Candidatus Sungbacteria bacterium RIFCSPLOWO2_01_FULL_47_32]OHA09751.1 MAG: hypothetical protein A3H69_03825 [Candidatus Sungbacteria bacterium RIFCSPLOWO2_02_FULL_47_9]
MAFTVKQEQFEGPLDILLEFIEKEKLSINQISLASVADEYVRFVKTLTAIDREELAEFLVVAAQLVLIKSRSLLPNTALSEEEEVSIEELERRLAEHKRLKELSQSLQGLAGANRHMYTREFYSGFESVFYPPKKVTAGLLKKVFNEILQAIPKIEKLAEEKIKKIITLEEKIGDLKRILENKVERIFSDIVSKSSDKIEIIVSFLAILELARQQIVSLDQETLFGDIKIKKD